MSRVLIPLLAAFMAAAPAAAQSRKPIEAQDGDVIVVRDAMRVRIVRREEGNVRAIYEPAERWLLLLVDESSAGRPPDARVDQIYSFNDVEGDWPLGARWDGYATLDDYSIAGELGGPGIGIATPAGLVQLLGSVRAPLQPRTLLEDPAAAAVLRFAVFGRGRGSSDSFDEAEARQVAIVKRNAANIRPPGFATSVGMTMTPEGTAGGIVTTRGATGASAPLRVGGNIVTPAKIQDAPPVMPPLAAQANLHGVVILEVTVGADGRVTQANVLRSIPLLDQAAIDAVRQWRFTPTLLNGVAVPIIMTVAVPFP
jgi:TonB family protein